MPKVAITGGIGEGKSTVLAMLAEMGYQTASSDEIARQVFAQEDVQRLIAEATGLPTPIDRQNLRERLSSDAEARREVNRIMHPKIRQILDQTQADFTEVPLLIEAVLQNHYDQVWVVTCGREEQRRRLVERYGNEARAEAIIRTQMASRAKTPFADYIIRTNESMENVRRFVSACVKHEIDEL